MTRFQDRTVLITGGAGGIGGATARRFHAEGARVAVFDLVEAPAPDNRHDNGPGGDPGGDGGRWLSCAFDGTDAEAQARALKEVEARFGPVDILFNNLGRSARERAGLFCESEEDTWRFVLDINLITTMRLSRRVAPGMAARGHGRIVNMSSDAALSGDLRLADYATAKMGVIGFTRALAMELAPKGVTVNAVCPGAIATEAHRCIPRETLDALVAATPAGFIASPEDVAGLVAYLASDEARFVTGQTIAINGGRNLL
ncbi:SDR family NAD(P)-dependent oxidoreductase [Acidimangrovimonas sediminis]|uniref:SDR family NAD(P)-dependent oxidoreductase n=1 Tax=Acidimangrovimonas sediminis TaxID=2056283 RepID=UPI000C7F93CF|nr:SDR family NAD(P)-dependent oxidoreductase [Acidimangrovimonas sediminis]